MLYKKNQAPELSEELFKNPSSEYRGTPFWAWNGKLNKEKLQEQILNFKKMGLGGFHMHVRTGMDSPYLDEEFMDYIQHCTEIAKKEEMLAWLYDEDRWPSGTAGGRVTKNKPENARKTLLFTVTPYSPDRHCRNTRPEPGRGQENIRQENGELLAVYDILLNEDGTLSASTRVTESAPLTDGCTRWYAYMEYATEDPWFNNCAYVDTLNPDAIREFIEITHEAYYQNVGKDFGSTIPAIFTDEPQFTPKEPLSFASEQKDVFLPWTLKMPEHYQQAYNEDLLDFLPELLWELPNGQLSTTRWRFQNLLTDIFVQNYCYQIGNWCQEHGILMTGHVMGEGGLYDQTQAVGDAMRCYRAFGLPGIDMLCDFHEYTTAKQTQSIVRQTGKEGMLSELYGVTGWDYDFRGYKLQGDWQAALGVTVRVPHLAWMTMKGEAKRDYPASISYQSSWWEEFSMVEDHFSRLNTALTRGKAKVTTAILHPIESYWLHWGPGDQTGALREQMEEQFKHLAETLLFGQIDFDYLCEAELPVLCETPSAPLQVGYMAYDAVLVPPIRTIRSSTIAILKAFAKAGGKLLFLGDCPDYVDAVPSDACKELYALGTYVGMQDSSILSSLEENRFLDIRRPDGKREDRLLHQIRQESNGNLWLFICNGKNPACPDVDPGLRLRFILNGSYTATLYDTLSGKISPLEVSLKNGKTIFERPFFMHDSLLLLLVPANTEKTQLSSNAANTAANTLGSADILFENVPVTMEEPNMLLLDMAEYSFNNSEFYSEEELLRIDNNVRAMLGLPMRRKEVCQPYLLKEETPKDFLLLRFRIPSEYVLSDVYLALEDPQTAEITLNGTLADTTVIGYYVDKDIKKIKLPSLVKGENILTVRVPIGTRTNLEYFYLLGDFGVRINGTQKTITAPVNKLGWGDIVSQNLPFYTGPLLYHLRVKTDGDFQIRVPQYRGGLIKVFVDGKDCGNIAFSPYTLHISAEAGEHTVVLKLYGTRQNGFAQLHHTQGVYFYQSPNSWRSAGDLWSYEYRFKPAGILKSPEIIGGVFLTESGAIRKTGGIAAHITDQS